MPLGFVINLVSIPNNIQLAGVKGSVWQSHIDTIALDDIRIDNIDASLSFLSLLSLNPTVKLTFGDPMLSGIDGHATLSGSKNHFKIEDAVVSVPANLVAKFAPSPVEIVAHKYIELELEEFEFGVPICQSLAGLVNWRQAAVTVYGQKVELSDLQGALDCLNGDLVLNVKQPNALGLSLSAKIGKNMRIYGEGYVQPTATTPKAIMDVLPLVSRPDDQGRYPLRF